MQEKMKNYIPTIIAISIFLGLLTFIKTTNFLFESIIDTPSKEKPLIILKKSENSDTLSTSTKSKNVPIVEIGKAKNKKRLYLNVFPATLNWIIFHSVALSIGVALLIFFISLLFRLIKRFQLNFFSKESIKVILPLVIITILILVLFSYLGVRRDNVIYGAEIMDYFNIIFKDPQNTIGLIEKAFFAIAIIPLFGILIISLATNRLNNFKSDNQHDINADYKVIKDSLNIFAFVTGLLVAISIIGTSLQRKMISEQISGIKEIFPDEFIYAYGIAFTLILALFFLPSLVFLKYLKINKNITFDEDKDKSIRWWKIGQESIGDIKLIFSIVLPLLTSIVQSYFNT